MGRIALITGASGGIGWATAVALAGEGCRLALCTHRGGDRTRAQVEAAGLSDRAIVIEADVRSPDQVEAAFDAAVQRFGRIDICVTSAGIWPEEPRRVDEMEPARIREVLAVNLEGTLYTARAFLRQLGSRGVTGSSLVLVGSTAGRFGEAGHIAYSASKAALRGVMLSYKNEVVLVDPTGRCNLVEPGWTRTPMTEEALKDDANVAHVLRTAPLRQIARAEDVAAAILYFCSPTLAAHVTGQTLTIAGGMEGRLLWQPEEIDLDRVREHLSRKSDWE